MYRVTCSTVSISRLTLHYSLFTFSEKALLLQGSSGNAIVAQAIENIGRDSCAWQCLAKDATGGCVCRVDDGTESPRLFDRCAVRSDIGSSGPTPCPDIQQLGLEDLDPTDASQLTSKWLEQPDPRLLAWAAFWIERDDQFQRVPQLLEIVARYNSGAGNPSSSSKWTDDAALMAVLDALIYLHADVPVNEAEALYGKFPVQALILLSRSHDDTEEALLRILDKTANFIDWLAAADLLAAKPPAGFAARLLKIIAINAFFRVLEPGQTAVGEGWGGDCASSGEDPRPKWPPIGAYRLTAR